jgi:hypothetical protein
MDIKYKLCSNPLATAYAFNTYFSSAAENLLIKIFSGKNTTDNNDPISYLRQNFRQSSSTIKLSNTTTHETEKIIHFLKCKNSYGHDEISSRILKVSAPYVLSPLMYIFNKILSTGIFSERLKFSEVKPLYKKGDKTEFSNYRPISLLTSFSNIIEKIIYKRLYCHLNNNNNILVNEQFGFREKLSTETATYTLTLSWEGHIDHLLPKLCLACYGVGTINPFMCQENLKSIYYSYFHSLMTYEIIFWGISAHNIYVFRLLTRVIRIITDSRPRDSCRQLFKQLGILPFISQ